MKKLRLLITFLMLAAVLVIFCAPAYADVIWEPEDSFYTSHSEECEHDESEWYANAKSGETPVYKSPENSSVIAVVKNGEVINISFTYKGEYGIIETTQYTGWVRLGDLTRKYGNKEFLKEHENDFSYKTLTLPKKEKIVAYTYPQSGEIQFDDYHIDEGLSKEEFLTYTDAEQRTWVYIPYMLGQKNAWICVDDCDNANIPAETDRTPQIYGKDLPTEGEKPKITAVNGTVLAICLAAAAVIITGAVILIVFIKKKK